MTRSALDADSEEAIDLFAAVARDFCSWLEEPAGGPPDPYAALRRLACLYDGALHLPEIGNEYLESAGAMRSEAPANLRERVMARLTDFPEPKYWRVALSRNRGVESVEDDLARDIFLTYSAVKGSLSDFELGREYRYSSVWSWRFSFWLDWGRHATNAIQALHARFHEDANEDE
jgi:uncharacterized protein DUF5063